MKKKLTSLIMFLCLNTYAMNLHFDNTSNISGRSNNYLTTAVHGQPRDLEDRNVKLKKQRSDDQGAAGQNSSPFDPFDNMDDNSERSSSSTMRSVQSCKTEDVIEELKNIEKAESDDQNAAGQSSSVNPPEQNVMVPTFYPSLSRFSSVPVSYRAIAGQISSTNPPEQKPKTSHRNSKLSRCSSLPVFNNENSPVQAYTNRRQTYSGVSILIPNNTPEPSPLSIQRTNAGSFSVFSITTVPTRRSLSPIPIDPEEQRRIQDEQRQTRLEKFIEVSCSALAPKEIQSTLNNYNSSEEFNDNMALAKLINKASIYSATTALTMLTTTITGIISDKSIIRINLAYLIASPVLLLASGLGYMVTAKSVKKSEQEKALFDYLRGSNHPKQLDPIIYPFSEAGMV